MTLRQITLPLLAVLFSLAVVSPASAATIIAIDDPSTAGVDVVLDDFDFDGVATTGGVISVGVFPGTFAFGVGNTTAARMDLAAILASFEEAAELNLLFTQTGFTTEGLATSSITGSTSGDLIYASYYDPSDAPFGMANLIGGPLVFGPGVLSASTSAMIAAGVPFSMTQAISLRHPAGEPSVTDFTASVQVVPAEVVPEPATMTLFGLGLAGAAAARRRRQRSAE